MTEPMDTGDEEGEVLLNPKTSERKHWRDNAGLQRQIWRPGDGDGDYTESYGEASGLVGSAEKRWKFYQLSTSPIRARINEPPKNVILDDLACWELLASNMPKAQLSKNWPQDFSGQGKLRARRPHRGRAAVIDPNATTEKERYQSYDYGGKGGIYYFTGERAYEPVLYAPFEPEPDLKAEPEEPAIMQDTKPKGHNQYTAVDKLVRNGAQSMSKTRGKYRERVNTFLRRSPSPEKIRSGALIFGGLPAARLPGHSSFRDTFRDMSMTPGLNFDPTHGMSREPIADGPLPGIVQEPVESMFVEQDEDDEPLGPSVLDEKIAFAEDRRKQLGLKHPRPKRSKRMGYIERLAAGLLDEDMEAEHEAMVAREVVLASEGSTGRVLELERELERARAVIAEQNGELGRVRAQLEALQTEVAMMRSMADA